MIKISVQPHTPIMFTWPTFNAPVCPKAQIWKCSTHCFCDGSKVDPKAAPESSLSVFFRRFFPGVRVAGRDINRLGLLCDCIEEKAQIIQWQEKEDKWKTASMGGGGGRQGMESHSNWCVGIPTLLTRGNCSVSYTSS